MVQPLEGRRDASASRSQSMFIVVCVMVMTATLVGDLFEPLGGNADPVAIHEIAAEIPDTREPDSPEQAQHGGQPRIWSSPAPYSDDEQEADGRQRQVSMQDHLLVRQVGVLYSAVGDQARCDRRGRSD